MKKVYFQSVVGMAVLIALPSALCAQDPLETETARFLKQGMFKLVNAVEYQSSPDGKEVAIPLQMEFGILDNLEFMIEPVVYTSIRPKSGPWATGSGDTEITLGYLFLEESDPYPALAVDIEVKVPTTKNPLIGTGEVDYNLTVVASKKFGDLDLHANVGYTLLGSPRGTSLDNTFNFALAAVYPVSERFDLVGELLGVTSSGGGESATTPEAGGGEFSGFFGTRWHPRPNVVLAAGAGYDNNSAVLFRIGLSLKF
jgi:hypothetical protein